MSNRIGRLVASAAGLLAILAAPVAAQTGTTQAPSPVPEAMEAYLAGDYALALARWQAACDNGNPQGCYHAAIVHRDGEGVPADPERAEKLLDQACDGGVGNACFNLGNAASGRTRIAYLLVGCGYANIASCARLGMAYRDGEGVPLNPARAVEFFEKSCLVDDMAAGPACFMLAMLYDAHDESSLFNEPETSNRWLARGCAMLDHSSCQNLAWHYAHGFGVETDTVRSAALYQLACGDMAGLECSFVPRSHRSSPQYRGPEILDDYREAGGAYHRACEHGFAPGCFGLARLIASGGMGSQYKDRMRGLLERAIELDPGHVAAIELLRRVETGELPDRPVY